MLSERPLPPPLDGVLPLWPGGQVDRLLVRRGPAEGGEPALLVHGLGGSSARRTDLVWARASLGMLEQIEVRPAA